MSTGKRGLKDFEDPRLKGEVNSVDFESILKIAVLCVAKSSKGRPTIDVVFEEMDKVSKNTLSNKVCLKAHVQYIKTHFLKVPSNLSLYFRK